MPHVIVKLYPGRTKEQKETLVKKITQAVTESLGVPDESLSIGLEEVEKDTWDEVVKKPDILAKQDTIYKHSKSSRPS